MSGETFSKKEVMNNIYPLIENTCMRFNLIPLEVDFVKESGRWFLRIFIYSNDHDVNHMDCENVSRSLSDFLDELIPVKYNLEISSPGLERRLKSEKEYIIFCGKVVEIKLKNPLEGEKEKVFKALLLDYNDGIGATVERLSDGKELTISLDNIFSSRLCFEENEKQYKKEIEND